MFGLNKTLVQNFSSLTILQISNYLFPIITFPYLVRVLGPDKFGLVNFAAAFVAYFNVFTDYGFNLSATKDISINRNNPAKVNEIFSTILVIKFILFIVSLILFSVLVFTIPRFSASSDIYIYSFMIVLGTVLFPGWFFQGMEKMKYITITNVTVKVIWAVLVFTLIRSADDVLLLVILNGCSFIFIGLFSLILLIKIFKVKFIAPSISQIKMQLINGWYVFVSTASITLYTTSNVFILGLFAGNEVVGYFAAADKIRIAVQGLFGNAGQTVFPHLSKMFEESKKEAVIFVKKYRNYSVSIAVILTVMLFALAKPIVLIVLGNGYEPSVNVFRIILFLPLIILLSNIYGIQVMLNLNYKKEFFRIILFAGIVNLILSFILVPFYFEIGTAIAVVTTETVVTVGMIAFVRGRKLLKGEVT
jgi:PST family polysaccharide transporter